MPGRLDFVLELSVQSEDFYLAVRVLEIGADERIVQCVDTLKCLSRLPEQFRASSSARVGECQWR